MSRSNHIYYNLCTCDSAGRCRFHCIHTGERRAAERTFMTRRGAVHRRSRFPSWSIKTWHRGPQQWWKQMWHQKARAVQKAEMLANPDDPVVTPMRRIVDMWDWY